MFWFEITIDPSLPLTVFTIDPTEPLALLNIDPTLPLALFTIGPTLPLVLLTINPTLPLTLFTIDPTLPLTLLTIDPTLPLALFTIDPTLPATPHYPLAQCISPVPPSLLSSQQQHQPTLYTLYTVTLSIQADKNKVIIAPLFTLQLGSFLWTTLQCMAPLNTPPLSVLLMCTLWPFSKFTP